MNYCDFRTSGSRDFGTRLFRSLRCLQKSQQGSFAYFRSRRTDNLLVRAPVVNVVDAAVVAAVDIEIEAVVDPVVEDDVDTVEGGEVTVGLAEVDNEVEAVIDAVVAAIVDAVDAVVEVIADDVVDALDDVDADVADVLNAAEVVPNVVVEIGFVVAEVDSIVCGASRHLR